MTLLDLFQRIFCPFPGKYADRIAIDMFIAVCIAHGIYDHHVLAAIDPSFEFFRGNQIVAAPLDLSYQLYCTDFFSTFFSLYGMLENFTNPYIIIVNIVISNLIKKYLINNRLDYFS